jgi:hypothetical protein
MCKAKSKILNTTDADRTVLSCTAGLRHKDHMDGQIAASRCGVETLVAVDMNTKRAPDGVLLV